MTVTVPSRKPARKPSGKPIRAATRTEQRPGTEQDVRPDPRPGPDPSTSPAAAPDGRARSAAAQRAYARRAQRTGQAPEPTQQADPPTGRARFVVLVIGLLVGGIATTLWLSTQAISDSYHLEQVKQNANDLSERADTLQREVTKLDSPSALAQRAKELGMVFPGDPARLVVRPDGTIAVVGEPKPAPGPTASAPPPAGDQPAQPGPGAGAG